MHVLLTGASSFIGGHLAHHLLDAGHLVTATYRRRNAAVDQLAARARPPSLVSIDIADAALLDRLPRAIDAIVHVAGVSILPGVSADDMLACNVVGTRNLLAYSQRAGATQLVHASTVSVHGRIEEPEVDETTPVRDPDLYGASKYLAERQIAAEADRLPAVAVRLPGVLGPGAHRAWLPALIQRLRRHEDVTIYNPESPFNNAAHVDDLGRFVIGLLGQSWSGFHAFPIGADGTMPVRCAVDTVAAAVGSRSRIEVSDPRQPNFTISSRFAERRFGYRPMPIGAMLTSYATSPDPS